MVVLIAMLTGIADYVALLALFALNAAMIFLGWLMELLNPPDRARTRWLPFVLGGVVGAVAWVAIAVQSGVLAGRGHAPPGFVYGIFLSLFVLFNNGERWYLWLSLIAKSLLAWQVFCERARALTAARGRRAALGTWAAPSVGVPSTASSAQQHRR